MLEIHHVQQTPPLLAHAREFIYMPRYRGIRQQWHTDPSEENRSKGWVAAEQYYTSNIDHIGALKILPTPLNTDDARAYRAHVAFVDLEHLSHSLGREMPEWVASETNRNISHIISLANNGSKQATALYSSYLSSSSADIRNLAIKNIGSLSLPAEIRVLNRHAANQQTFFGSPTEQHDRLVFEQQYGQYSINDLSELIQVLNTHVELQLGNYLGSILEGIQTPSKILNTKAEYRLLLEEVAGWRKSDWESTRNTAESVLSSISDILAHLKIAVESVLVNYADHIMITNSVSPNVLLKDPREIYKNGKISQLSRGIYKARYSENALE